MHHDPVQAVAPGALNLNPPAFFEFGSWPAQCRITVCSLKEYVDRKLVS